MDQRVAKTKDKIRSAFLELRLKIPLEKIKVSRLCELAMINKTTFYKHYQDVFALSDEIELETIESILSSFEHIDVFTTDPENFIKGLYHVINFNNQEISLVFSGRINALMDKIESQLILRYPQFIGVPEKEILLSFMLRGATSVLIKARYEKDLLLDTLITMTRNVLPLLG